jgi:PAS domain S-box-containing protein
VSQASLSENKNSDREECSESAGAGTLRRNLAAAHVLDRISAILVESGLKFDETMRSIAQLLTEILGDICFIRLISDDGRFLNPCACHDVDPDFRESIEKLFFSAPLPIHEGLTGRAVLERRPVQINFASTEEAQRLCAIRYESEIKKFGLSCAVSTPMICRGEIIGTLILVRRGHRPLYTTDDENLVWSIAQRAAIVIENARLFEQVKRAKDEASVLANRMRVLSDAIPALVSYIDSSLTYRFVNASYERILLLPKDQIVGRHMSEVMRPESFAIVQPKITEALRGERVKFESEFTLKSGEKRILEISYVPNWQNGKIKGVYGLIHDVTERKFTEIALKQSIEEISRARAEAEKARQLAEAGNRAKDLFLATLSHELRTPLTTILAYAQMIRLGMLNEEGCKKGVQMIEQSASTQAQLINDLLDISRITMGKLELNLKEVYPAEIVRATIDSVHPQLIQKSLAIQTELSAPGLMIYADPVRLKQICINLLTNAIKFSNIGGCIEVRLEAVHDEGGDSICLKVTDHGKGIDPEFLPYVFDRFRQADSTTTRVHGGMGLGLAIVRALAEQHGGSALAESEGVGKGATISIILPMRAGQVADETSTIFRPGDAASDSPDWVRGLKVLLVDDDKSARESLALLLSSLGAKVRTAASAFEGYQSILEEKPDILVSDIAMPGQDGYSLMSKIRELDPKQGGLVPSIALTAFASPEDTQRAHAAGFQAHVAKPVSVDGLVQAISGILDPSRTRA